MNGVALVKWERLGESSAEISMVEAYLSSIPGLFLYHSERRNLSPKLRTFVDGARIGCPVQVAD